MLDDLPPDWRLVRLAEIVEEFISGGTPSTGSPAYWDGPIPWITGADAEQHIAVSARKYITERGVAESATHVVPKGNILLVTRTGVGKVSIAGVDIAISQDLTGIVPNPNLVNVGYLYRQLKHASSELQRLCQGTIILGVQRKEIEDLTIPLPPLAEQRRIAEILDAADGAIRQTERVIAKLRHMKAGLLHDLLTRGIDEEGRLRDPVAHPERFIASSDGRLPRGWRLISVGDLGTWQGGSTPSKSEPSYWSDGTVVWLSPKDIHTSRVVDSEDRITQHALDASGLRLFDPGNVVVVFRSGILRHSFPVALVDVPFTINQDLKVLLTDPTVVPRYAFRLLQHIGHQVLRLAVKSGTTVQSIDGPTFYSLPLRLPPIHEQTRISAVLDACDAQIFAEEDEIAKLRLIKQGLMDDLLTGRVRVT